MTEPDPYEGWDDQTLRNVLTVATPLPIDVMAEAVEYVNRSNGWFEADRSFGEDIALLHSEVSEMLEEFRDGRLGRYVELPEDDRNPEQTIDIEGDNAYPQGFKPIGVPSEAADVLIRLLDTCARYGIDLEAEFRAKLAYNATRGNRHGGKKL